MPADDEPEPEYYENEDPRDFVSAVQPPADGALADVDSASLAPAVAYQSFSRPFNPLHNDHSGTIASFDARRRGGPLGGAQTHEAPLARLARLRAEAAELEALFGEAAAAANGMAESRLGEATLAELRALQQQLAALAASPLAAVGAGSGAQPGVAAKLLRDLERFKVGRGAAGGGEPEPAAAAEGMGGGRATYELYVSPGQGGDAAPLRKVAELERRLAVLESATGVGSAGAGAALPRDLLSTVSSLGARVALMDKGSLTALTHKATAVTHQLKDIQKEKRELEDHETEAVNKVAAAVERWEPLAEELPLVIERLFALRRVHTEAAELTGAVATLSSSQTVMQSTIASQESLLAKLEANLEKNMQTMAQNMKVLEGRYEALAAQ